MTDPSIAADPENQSAHAKAPPSGSEGIKPGHALVLSSATSVFEAHPYADLFPKMVAEAFDGLVASVRVHGLEEPIIMYEGKILDGRNRYAACLKAGVEPRTDDYDGADPLGYVMARNVHRRHLSVSLRSLRSLVSIWTAINPISP